MGIYRFLLACCVVIEHVSGNQYVTHTSMFAVFGFYVLSGYLITRVLRDAYDFDSAAFWSNRALRLFPLYAVFLTVGLLLIFGTTGAGAFFPAVWQVSPTPMDWLGVLTVFPMGLSPSALVAHVACRCQDAIIEPIRNGIRAAVSSIPPARHQAVA